jgi:hypothetical protein
VRVLVYKRTHTGDPDPETGTFGCNHCMGSVRGWNYDAVIGVGGIGAEPVSHDIAGKVTWIGIGPHHVDVGDERGPGVQFDHFLLYDADGPVFRKLAPKLAKRMYDNGIRVVLHDLTATELAEVAGILKRANNAPPSPGKKSTARRTRSVSKCVPTKLRNGGC